METLPLLLAALLALCFAPSAAALKCGACSSPPWYPGAPPCDKSKIEVRSCPLGWDRCFTLNATAKGVKFTIEIKNCTSSIGCDPDSPYYVCKFANATGLLSSCSLSCCSDDECNMPKEDQISTGEEHSSRPEEDQNTTEEEQSNVPKEEQVSTQQEPLDPLNSGKDKGSFLKCGVCSSPPWYPGAPPCEKSKMGMRTCPLGWDRCFTATAQFKDKQAGSQSFEIKNCTTSFGCDPNSPYYACNYVNITGAFSSCSVSCCPDDLCNVPKKEQTSTTEVHYWE